MELIWENPFYPHLHKIQSQNKHFIFLQADEEYLNEDIVSTMPYGFFTSEWYPDPGSRRNLEIILKFFQKNEK